MGLTINSITKSSTQDYLDQIDKKNPPCPEDIEQNLLLVANAMIDGENSIRAKGDKLKKLNELTPSMVADIINCLYHVRLIYFAGDEQTHTTGILGIFITEGALAGTYSTDFNDFRKIVKMYNYNLSKHFFEEVMATLQTIAKPARPCNDPDLVFVNNGIFNYRTKQLIPFAPKYVSASKSRVNYNDQAQNIVIHNDDDNTDWDVESWMKEFFDSPEMVNLLWEILGAIIRPNVRWKKSVWFMGTEGNNGKGTLCELMRCLCGDGNYTSIQLSDMSKDFMLEPLLKVSAIITDENDVGAYIDRCANMKAVITNDVVMINRKHQSPISFQFRGIMVQCLNDFPRAKDRSGSFYRRQLFVPFTKCFTGRERSYIKDDYLHRQEVLEYVLYRVLNMNCYTLSEPQDCVAKLNEYKRINDPVLTFAEEIIPSCQWDLLPNEFLYDLFKAWFKRNNPSGIIIGRNTFLLDLEKSVPKGWVYDGKQYRIRTMLSIPEPLIEEYDLTDWYGDRSSMNPARRLVPTKLCSSYRGLIRDTALAVYGTDDCDNDDSISPQNTEN